MQKKVHTCPSLSFLPVVLAAEAAKQGASSSDTTPGRALAEVLERGGIAYEKSIQFAFRHEETPSLPHYLEKKDVKSPSMVKIRWNYSHSMPSVLPFRIGTRPSAFSATSAYVCPHATANTTTKYIAVKMPTLMRSFPVCLPPIFDVEADASQRFSCANPSPCCSSAVASSMKLAICNNNPIWRIRTELQLQIAARALKGRTSCRAERLDSRAFGTAPPLRGGATERSAKCFVER